MDLGFVEICKDNWKLLNHYFPSKLGGPPAWLCLKPLPGFDDLKCQSCGSPCKFLLQLYSPGDDDDEEEEDNSYSMTEEGEAKDKEVHTAHYCANTQPGNGPDAENASPTFHRSLYVFVCDDSKCSNHAVKCLRSQLPRKNEFYSYNPPDYDQFDESLCSEASAHGKVCHVCNCRASKSCGQCKKYSYCCKEHQVMHWIAGHKISCGTDKSAHCCKGNDSLVSNECNYFFKEFEIVMDVEKSPTHKKSEEERNQEYKKYLGKGSLEHCTDWDSTKEVKVADKAFMEFREKIADNPDQIIRYDRGGQPLLVSDETDPPASIPDCELCGGPREFEFQVLSQVLSYLDVDTGINSLDWGTLVIYTCKKSCRIQGYANEFVWKQDYSDKDVVSNK